MNAPTSGIVDDRLFRGQWQIGPDNATCDLTLKTHRKGIGFGVAYLLLGAGMVAVAGLQSSLSGRPLDWIYAVVAVPFFALGLFTLWGVLGHPRIRARIDATGLRLDQRWGERLFGWDEVSSIVAEKQMSEGVVQVLIRTHPDRGAGRRAALPNAIMPVLASEAARRGIQVTGLR